VHGGEQKLEPVRNDELAENATEIIIYSQFANREHFGDVAVSITLYHQVSDFLFAIVQRLLTLRPQIWVLCEGIALLLIWSISS
jgi:hypothetical protein